VTRDVRNELESRLDNPDMQAAPLALLRAARRARQIARETGTAIVIVRDGVLVEERVTTSDDEGQAPRGDVIHDGD
jgi:hypothetical protein